MKNKGLTDDIVIAAISSHEIDYDLLSTDNFNEFFVNRATKLLNRIERATGKPIAGRDSEETIKAFGGAL